MAEQVVRVSVLPRALDSRHKNSRRIAPEKVESSREASVDESETEHEVLGKSTEGYTIFSIKEAPDKAHKIPAGLDASINFLRGKQ